MVGRNHIDGSVEDPFSECLSVFLAANRRIHLESSVLLQILIRKNQVVRRGFAGDIHASCLGFGDNFHAFLRGNVADVVFTACLFCQLQIPLYRFPFAFGGNPLMPVSLRIISVMNIAAVSQSQILAMRCNKKVMVLCSFHCLLHQVGVVQPHTIIAETDDKRRHLFKLRKFPALLTHRNCSVRPYIDAGIFFD